MSSTPQHPDQVPRAVSRAPLAGARTVWLLAILLAVVGVGLIVLTRPRSSTAQTVGDLAILAAVLGAVGGCLSAMRRGGPAARSWTVMAMAMVVWSAAEIVWTTYGLFRDHVYPFPSVADLGFIAYSLPVAAALLLFPRSSLRRGSRLREILDAGVIAASVLFVSWATVLGPLYNAGGSGSARLVGLAYPVVDVVVASLVLVLGMRVPAGQRRCWLLLGGGLVTLAVTDSIYVSMTLAGKTGTTGPSWRWGGSARLCSSPRRARSGARRSNCRLFGTSPCCRNWFQRWR